MEITQQVQEFAAKQGLDGGAGRRGRADEEERGVPRDRRRDLLLSSSPCPREMANLRQQRPLRVRRPAEQAFKSFGTEAGNRPLPVSPEDTHVA